MIYLAALAFVQDNSTNNFISVWLQHYSRMDGWMEEGGGRVDWLFLALWVDSVVVENWYHSQRQRERETLGRSWNEKNRCTANRGRGASPAVDIKCIYTQACFFSSRSKFLQFPSTPFFCHCLKRAHVHPQGHQQPHSHTRACELSSFRTLRSLISSLC